MHLIATFALRYGRRGLRGVLETAHKARMTKPVSRNSNEGLHATFPRDDPLGGFGDGYGPFQCVQSRRARAGSSASASVDSAAPEACQL